MRVVVTPENKPEVIFYLRSLRSSIIALDTETYGLRWHHDMFSMIITVQDGDSFYFNFKEYPNEVYNGGPVPVLSYSILAELHDLWMNPEIRWVLANAKYDMRRLDIHSVWLNGEIYDVLLMERIRYNRHMSYSLDACLKRINLAKNDVVSLWVKDNKAYTSYHVEGKKTREKDLHYDRVPFGIICPYGFDDTEGTLAVYNDQIKYFMIPENTEQLLLVGSNVQLTKAVFKMERRGIKLDLEYVKRQLEIENTLALEKYDRIEQMTNQKFKAGPKWLTEVLNAQGVELQLSDKGNPILDKSALKAIPNAVAHYVLEARDHEKRAGTYSTLARFVDTNGVLHTNYRLNGTDTLRFSSNDPNLQNIEGCGEGDLESVRTAFVPREGFFFVSIDYKAMEYRLVADIAGEMGWIEAINNGADPHQWVADLMGSERKAAKTLNFMLLYGGGLAKLAHSLFKCLTNEDQLHSICMIHLYNSKREREKHLAVIATLPVEVIAHEMEQLQKANKLKQMYFEALPKVEAFTNQVQEVAQSRGYLRNAFGMRYFLDNPRFAYKMPNHLIQGTGGCVIRGAMPKLDYFCEGYESQMLLQIHDELLFECRYGEESIVPEWKRIMESEYKPMNGMFLECDADYSLSSWNANSFKKWSEYGR